jgi:hypothetical protein
MTTRASVMAEEQNVVLDNKMGELRAELKGLKEEARDEWMINRYGSQNQERSQADNSCQASSEISHTEKCKGTPDRRSGVGDREPEVTHAKESVSHSVKQANEHTTTLRRNTGILNPVRSPPASDLEHDNGEQDDLDCLHQESVVYLQTVRSETHSEESAEVSNNLSIDSLPSASNAPPYTVDWARKRLQGM